jgi:competence ComEA-like helix-hairpin-helix protein
MFTRLRDYFGFSRQEVRGFLVLVVLMLILWFSPLIYDRFFTDTTTELAQSDRQTADSLTAVLESVQPEKRSFEKYQTYQKYDGMAQNPEKPFVLTEFDPNIADSEQLQSLGIPRFIAERIVKYRSKGGQFRKKEDLKRIYDFPPKLYDKLEPYITLSTGNQFVKLENKFADKPTFVENKPAFVKPVFVAFDINTADTIQLIKLKGIGSKLATRIVKFRDGLGGFISTNQYTEVFGLDSLALAELNKFALVRSEPQKINVNTASIEALDKHIYISAKQAQIIVRYREQHGNYNSPADMLKIKIFDEKYIDKIKPYLEF